MAERNEPQDHVEQLVQEALLDQQQFNNLRQALINKIRQTVISIQKSQQDAPRLCEVLLSLFGGKENQLSCVCLY